jgi:hypothetical protein
MKHFGLFIIAVLLIAGARGQTKPYASVGVSLSTNVVTGGLEIGCYDTNNWYAIVAENYKINGVRETYIGLKYYRKVRTLNNITDMYVFGAVKVHADHYKDLVFEPGIAIVVNLGRRFALQTSVSTPIYENSTLFKPVNLSGGLGLNWWIDP